MSTGHVVAAREGPAVGLEEDVDPLAVVIPPTKRHVTVDLRRKLPRQALRRERRQVDTVPDKLDEIGRPQRRRRRASGLEGAHTSSTARPKLVEPAPQDPAELPRLVEDERPPAGGSKLGGQCWATPTAPAGTTPSPGASAGRLRPPPRSQPRAASLTTASEWPEPKSPRPTPRPPEAAMLPALERPQRQLRHPRRDGHRPKRSTGPSTRRSPRFDPGPAAANLTQHGGEGLPVGVKPA